jgi:two-component system response regulator
MTKSSIQILLVDDNPTDVLLTKRALAEAQLAAGLHTVEDGEMAMAFLRRKPPYQDAPRPDLILLDLNMPRKDGREVLAEVKSAEDLKVIPVCVLTTSCAEEDVLKSYQLHANCYIVKALGFSAFVEAIATLRKFWFAVVTLPSQFSPGAVSGGLESSVRTNSSHVSCNTDRPM